MTQPELAVRNSGMGGRGYKHPFTGQVVPSVTTVLKAAATPAITQWAVDQTAAYAVANIDQLLNRTEQQGWGYLRWYHGRSPLPLEAGIDLRNYHLGVLHDAAEQGTAVHEWIESDMDDTRPIPDLTGRDPEPIMQMIERWEEYKLEHEVKVEMIEVTVWHAELGYAGTFDFLAYIDGVLTLVDIKTSRGVWDSHKQQLAALMSATTYFTKLPDGEWFEGDWQEWMEKVDKFGLLHVRPDDYNSKGEFVPSYIEMDYVPDWHLDVYFDQFKALLAYKHGELRMKAMLKSEELARENNEFWKEIPDE